MNSTQVESMKRIILLVLCILLVASAYGADTQKLYNKTVTSVVSLKVDTPRGGCIGSGFYALEPDIIVTCYHVVEGATNITAKTSKGNIVSIDGIIDYSQEKDIALLKASSKNSTFLELQANMPKPGTPAYALGSPKGLDFSFSNGMVSQIRRGKETLIQFTCPVSSGNSGGPLLSEEGKVLGIVSCQLTEGQNLNFAVPSASLYMLNKDNAVTIVKNSSSISNNQKFKSNVHFQYGYKYYKAELYNEAISEFVEVLKAFPKSLEVYEIICHCFLATNDFEHLIKFANEAIKISISNNNKALLDKFYSLLGEAYYYRDSEKAIKYYKLALNENNGDNSNFLFYNNYKIAECYWRNSLYTFLNSDLSEKYLKQAIPYYEKALKINSKHFESTYRLGECYYLLKEDKKAIDYYEKALTIDSKHYESAYGLGNCYRNLNEYKKAIDYYEKALVLEKPVTNKVTADIGDCYRFLKDYKKAIEYYQKALKQEPNNSLIKIYLEDCKKQLRKK